LSENQVDLSYFFLTVFTDMRFGKSVDAMFHGNLKISLAPRNLINNVFRVIRVIRVFPYPIRHMHMPSKHGGRRRRRNAPMLKWLLNIFLVSLATFRVSSTSNGCNCIFPNLNAGISYFACFSPTSCALVNPRSTMMTSPSCKLSKMPQSLVMTLSLLQPPYEFDTKVIYPCGAIP
jgi:hypothetical protein